MANPKCAYVVVNNKQQDYWINLMPFMNDNQCVKRDSLSDVLYKGIETGIDVVNSLVTTEGEMSVN